jgi:lantibiotic modifying enzyme
MDIENEEFLLFLRCAQQNNLRYLCIGGYAVNYYGYHRFTEDLDIWIAPTNENKESFLNTLRCMGYVEEEIDIIKEEDFTTYFMCSLGSKPYIIDVITILHTYINFDEAEKTMVIHKVAGNIEMRMVPYQFLVDLKLRSQRPKDFWDVARLDELKKLKNKQ